MKTGSIQRRLFWIFWGIVVALLSGMNTSVMRIDHRGPIKTQAALKDLVLGIRNYQVEYDHFPLLKGQDAKVDQRVETTGKFLSVLLGRNEDGINPREIAYVEPPIAKQGKGGLAQDKLTDRWGHPYVVLMDGNNDNKIDNPDLKNSSPEVNKGVPAAISAGVIAYSLGPDGVEGTADDLTSWQSAPTSSPSTWSEGVLLVSIYAMIVSLVVIVGQGVWLIVDLVSLMRGKPTLTADRPTDQP